MGLVFHAYKFNGNCLSWGLAKFLMKNWRPVVLYTYYLYEKLLIRNSTLRSPRNYETSALEKYNSRNYLFSYGKSVFLFYFSCFPYHIGT